MMPSMPKIALAVLALFAALALPADAPAQCVPGNAAFPLLPHEADLAYLPTPHPVVDAMLRLAGVSRADVVYDLGSGDGRIPIAAARDFGARGVGLDLDVAQVEVARCNAQVAGLDKQVEFRHQDLFTAELREATVVTLFLFPDVNRRLAPVLRAQLRPGTRIVSHRFGLGDWKPDRAIEADGHSLLLWIVPGR
jgi:SAM-dependent methyltransferase